MKNTLLLILLIVSFNSFSFTQSNDPFYKNKTYNKTGNIISDQDFVIYVHFKGKPENMQKRHVALLANRGGFGQAEGILFGFHSKWGESKHKMLMINFKDKNYTNESCPLLLDSNEHKVAVMRKADYIYFYADGQFLYKNKIPLDFTLASPEAFFIGNDNRNKGCIFNGEIFNLSLFKGNCKDREISSLTRLDKTYELTLEKVASFGPITFEDKIDEFQEVEKVTEDGPSYTEEADYVKINFPDVLVKLIVNEPNSELEIFISRIAYTEYTFEIEQLSGSFKMSDSIKNGKYKMKTSSFPKGAYSITVFQRERAPVVRNFYIN